MPKNINIDELETRKRVGKRIRELLRMRDKTIAQMSRSIGIARTSINNILYGNAPLRAYDGLLIARFLNAPLEALFITDDQSLEWKREVTQPLSQKLSESDMNKITFVIGEVLRRIE